MIEKITPEYIRNLMNTGQIFKADRFAVAAAYLEAMANLNTLIYAVGMKYEGESRFETALRYIHNAEQCASHDAQKALGKQSSTWQEGNHE